MSEITVENITPETYTDDFVVDCARVSYAKRADQFTPEQNEKLIRYLFNPPDSVPHWAPFAGPRIVFVVRMDQFEWLHFFTFANLRGFSWRATGVGGLLNRDHFYEVSGSLWAWYENLKWFNRDVRLDVCTYLTSQFPVTWKKVFDQACYEYGNNKAARNVHGQYPETFTYNLRIKAPIFVARQLVKHQVDLVWSEVSRRYISAKPELWWPKEWHKAPTHSKQGASDELLDLDYPEVFIVPTKDQCTLYNELIDSGMAPEEARMILPQNMMTEWIWTGTHDAFRRVLRERLAPGAQKSGTRETAEKIKQALNW